MVVLFFMALISILGLLLLYAGIRETFFGDRYKSYPQVEGELLDFNLGVGKSDQQGNVRSKGLLWKLEVKYRYVADGKEYIGKDFSNIQSVKSMSYEETSKVDPVSGEDVEPEPPQEIRDYMDKLENMKQMPVYYNKRFPSSSFLFFEESPFLRNFVLLLMGGLMAFGSLAGGVLYYREHFT